MGSTFVGNAKTHLHGFQRMGVSYGHSFIFRLVGNLRDAAEKKMMFKIVLDSGFRFALGYKYIR
jgi:hypothetical protein